MGKKNGLWKKKIKNKNKNNIKKKQIKVSSILQLYFFDTLDLN